MPRPLLLAALATLPFAACAADDAPLARGEPLPCGDAAEVRSYRIDALRRAIGRAEIETDSLDLAGDGRRHNLLAHAMSAVVTTFDEPELFGRWRDGMSTRVQDDLVWVVQVATCGGDGPALVSLRAGEVDRAGGVRLAGPAGVPAPAARRGDRLVARDGRGVVPLGALVDLGDAAAPGWHEAEAIAVDLAIGGGALAGVIGGAVVPGYEEVALATWLPWVQARAAAGDPIVLEVLDDDGDGAITLAELRDSAVIRILLAPAFDALDAAGAYGRDGQAESLSFGYRIRATEIVVR